MKVTRQKELLYHHAAFLQGTGRTLQDHLQSAWQKLKYADDRAQQFGEDDDNVRVWNRRTTRGLLLCGMFHSFEKGRSQLLINVKKRVTEYPIVAADAQAAGGSADSEYNEGLLFFGVYKNHTIVLQSSSLRLGAFEDYVNWLLQDATDEFPKANRVQLRSKLPRKVSQLVSPLKSIILMPSIAAETAVTPTGEAANAPVREVKMRVAKTSWGWIREVLREMGGDVPEELRLDSNFNPDRVQVSIELKWLGRDKEREETPMLDDIMQAFRDVENPPIKAVTVNGDEIKGNELRLKKPVSLEVDGKLPVSGDVFEQMQKYITELLEKGEIPSE